MDDAQTVANGDFARALAAMSHPHRDGTSHHGRYATLPAILDVIRPILAEHHLAVFQPMTPDGVRTVFVHTNGAMIDAGLYPVAGSNNPQAQGSAVTYARRYALSAALGVSGVDDDAEHAVRTMTPGTRSGRSRTANSGGSDDIRVSAAQIKALQTRYTDWERDARLAEWERIVGRPVTTANELTRSEAIAILSVPMDDPK
jgi:hypothetical protein